jgi:hypothetical protein
LECWVGRVLDSNSSLIVIKKNTYNLRLNENMKVRILLVVDLVVKISRSSILSTTILGNISEPSLNTIIGVESLQVMNLWPADLRHTVDEVAFWVLGTVCAVRDMDGAVKAVVFRVTSAMVCLKLDEISESVKIPQRISESLPSSRMEGSHQQTIRETSKNRNPLAEHECTS